LRAASLAARSTPGPSFEKAVAVAGAQAKALCCYKKAAYGTVYALQAAVGAPYASNMEAKLVAGLEPLVALALTTAVACIGVYLAFSFYWCDCHRLCHPS